jgi:hypothetical protein
MEKIDIILMNMELVQRGVDFAERREKHPSYRMELIAVGQIVDDVIQKLKELKGETRN